jgi:hypothetical protein
MRKTEMLRAKEFMMRTDSQKICGFRVNETVNDAEVSSVMNTPPSGIFAVKLVVF